MSENKKYYYMKLKENFFSSERMVFLEVMPDGILYSNLLLKMYLMSLKHNGVLLLHENLPHTPQTIATFTRHQIGTVERALQIFLKLGFVELLTDGAYYMPDIQLLVGRSSTEAERKRRERLRLQAQKLLSNSKADICPPENRDKEIREQKCARTNIGSTAASDLTGATIDKNKVLISASEDGGDPVAVGFRAKKSNGKYKYYWLYRVKFGIPATNLATKGDSITFSTPTIEGTILRRNKADAGGKHPWKAEALEGDVTAATITNWYKEVYEPTYTTTPEKQG